MPEEYTTSAYVDMLTDAICAAYDTPPTYGQPIEITITDPVLVQMIHVMRHEYYHNLLRAVGLAITRMYEHTQSAQRTYDTPEQQKQDIFRNRLKYKDSWARWEHLMVTAIPTVTIIIPTDILPITRLADVSAHHHQHTLIATDVTVIGVDAQQLITTELLTSEGGWVLPGEYMQKEHGVILDRKYADVQNLIVEEYSDDVATGIARRIAARVRIPHVGQYTHGEHLRLYGYYTATEEDERKVIKRVFLDTVHLTVLENESDAMLEPEELADIQQYAQTDAEAYIQDLAHSIAPDIVGNESQKIVVLLAAIKGQIHGDSRSNLHVMLMDSPGSGKSELLKWVAGVMPKSAYVDAPNATAQGLLYGQEDFDGRKILHAGAVVRHDMIMLDEADKMPPQERKKLNSAIEQQVASYHKVPFMMEQRIDVGLIAAANPHGERWIDDSPISENTRSIEPALLSRCILTRMDAMSDVGRLVDAITGDPGATNVAKYTSRQIAGLVAHCRTQTPRYTAESRKTLKAYLGKFRAIQQNSYGDIPIDTRKEMDVVRLSSASAKLLHRSTVDDESIQLGIRIYQACLGSLGMQTEAPTVELKLASEPRDMIFWDIFTRLANADDQHRVREVELIKDMTDSGQWPSDEKATYYIRMMHERYSQIYQPTPGFFKRVG